jgi:hypothetical protein
LVVPVTVQKKRLILLFFCKLYIGGLFTVGLSIESLQLTEEGSEKVNIGVVVQGRM